MIKHVLAKALKYKAFYLDAKGVAEQVELDKKEYYSFRLVDEFFTQYARMPTRGEFLLKLSDLPESESEFIKDYRKLINEVYALPDEVDEKVLLDQLKEMAEKERIKKFLVRTADSFKDSKASEILRNMQDIVVAGQITGQRRSELRVEDVDVNAPLVRYHSSDERIPTGWHSLDRVLYGGVGVRELTCIMAPSGRGKSVCLVNLAHAFLEHKVNVLYVSMEMGVVDIMRRLYRRMIGADKDYLSNAKPEEIAKRVKRFFLLYKAQGRVVYYPANTISVEDIKAEMIKLYLRDGFETGVVIIDHLDLMISRTKSIRQKESHTYWRLIVDDLREIPLVQNIPVIVATQSNRKSSEKQLVTAMDVGESFGKVQSSDVVLSLNQTQDEIQNKRMRIAVIKNRDYLTGAAPEMYIDLDKMLICDLMTAIDKGLVETS